MQMIFVTPVAGARVRMPERQSAVMADAGAWVPRSVHYEHLLGCGDVLLADPQPELPAAEAAVALPAVSPLDSTKSPASASSKEK